jgi:hypothetical protein
VALEKQAVNINFAMGVETKTDPWQIPSGKFLRLVNAVFNKLGMLTKRNGFSALASLPTSDYTLLTTFNGDLTAIGNSLAARSDGSDSWVVQGGLTPVSVNSKSLIRSNLSQAKCDSAISAVNQVCVVYGESADGVTYTYKYAVADSLTGQILIHPAAIPVNGAGVVDIPPRVFVNDNYFIIVSGVNNAGNYTLQVVGIATNSLAVQAPFTISTAFIPSASIAMDGVVAAGNTYIAYNSGAGIRVTYLDPNLVQHNTVNPHPAGSATHMSVSADVSGVEPFIYVVYNSTATSTGFYFVLDQDLIVELVPTQWSSSANVLNISSAAQDDVCTIFVEQDAPYAYSPAVPNHRTITLGLSRLGVISATSTLALGVGLASKAFIEQDVIYVLVAYQSDFQSTYFLLNSSGKVISKHAPTNGGGYIIGGMPSVTVVDTVAYFCHQITSLIQAANKSQGVANPAGVYSQTGINLSSVTFSSADTFTAEIGNNLNIGGGFLASYDGVTPTENGFFLWPDNVAVSTSGVGGLITAQQYYYQALYEWTDNQGNIFRSAPSVPVTVTTVGATSSNTISVPMLRLTYKTENPVKIVIFRWSAAQQNYYQVTSITAPVMNDTQLEYVQFVDTQSDADILGNSLIYTTGGVLENVQAPASNSPALFDNRLWIIDAETNNLWFSKPVFPGAPVEMTDLQTYHVSQTVGANNQLGPVRVIAPMDDKLISFRSDSIVYTAGAGPNATGADNQYSQPIFITSIVGCSNARSVVMSPNGLMFQSNKGIWLLGRNLGTTYIGAPVEALTQGATVLSAFSVPETNQIRFTLSSGIVVVYDVYAEQWSWFEGCPAISATIYEGKHTYINSLGQVRQELSGFYLDGNAPVLLSFSTGWLNLVGLQGYERFYEMLMLGKFYTPFKLSVGLAFDYAASPSQLVTVTPDNYTGPWGSEANWGSGPVWGGPGAQFEARVFPDIQKCEAFQITVNEIYDPSYGVAAGAGLTLSGLNLVVGAKKNRRTSTAARSFG